MLWRFYTAEAVTKEKVKLLRCYGTEYDGCKQICCGNQVYDRTTGDEGCCGWKMFFTDTEICCPGNKIIMMGEKCVIPISP